ncbi:hypothetical protein [Marinilactibacillus kalidii]|nr:hypothetical protein [Marinilactibacillus kalidii]
MKKEEVILLNPEKLGYKDRGKMKWQDIYTHTSNRSYKSLKSGVCRY